MAFDIGVIECDVFSLNRQLTAIWYGITRVDHEVHEYLIHLSGISLDRAEIVRQDRSGKCWILQVAGDGLKRLGG